MAFTGVKIRSTKTPPGSLIIGWRQDLAIGDVLVFSLTSNAGIASYRWILKGRPEGSTAGGAGPEPINLGTASTATLTVDSDAPYPRDGTYIVHCILNEGLPSETLLTWGGARLSGLTTADGRVLRMLGGFEVAEDTADPLVAQGYNKMLERWLRRVAAAGGSTSRTLETYRASAEWQIWGRTPSSPAGNDIAAAINAQSNSIGGVVGPMLALPCFFPEAGTITDLAIVLTDDAVGLSDLCWLGIARSTLVGETFYPSATLASFTVRGSGTGLQKLRGGGSLGFATTGQELLFAIYQSNRNSSSGGTQLLGLDKRQFAPLFTTASGGFLGASLGSTIAAEGLEPNGAFAYEASWQANSAGPFNDPTYTVGRNFPASQPFSYASRRIPSVGTTTGFGVVPMILFKWTRT